jgi:hypothetical protein
MSVRCKRCNRVLTNEKSIKLGYGKICYRILILHGKKIIQEEYKEIPKLEDAVNFLKCEVKMIKRQLRELKFTKSVYYQENPIERIKREEAIKITDPLLKQYREAFKECINELKEVLKLRKDKIDNTVNDPIVLEVSQLALIN